MYKVVFKRLFDIIFSLVGLPFLFLILVIVSPLIYFEDRGPLFYNALRVGKNGKTFKMYKFRSMKVNAPDVRNEDGSTYNSEDDPRLTKIGRIIRKTSIDETPQLINVLFGDMSFIGPRPNMPTVPYEEMPEVEQARLKVRPGITGYNQAYYRNSISTEEKYANDLYYIDNISFVFDVKILFKTIYTVIKRENIYGSQ